MTDHIWAQEQAAAYVAGGLAGDDAARFETHLASCADCAALVAEAKHFDRGLGTLFAPLRPKPGLEDRAMRAVRVAPPPRAVFFLGWPRRATRIAAAIIATATFGGIAAAIIAGGRLPMPGEALGRASAKPAASLHATTGLPPNDEPAKDLTNDDPGLESNLEHAIPEIDRLAEKTVSDLVTNDSIGVPSSRSEDTAALKAPGLIANGKPQPNERFTGRSASTKTTEQAAAGGKDSRFNFYNGRYTGFGNGGGFQGGGIGAGGMQGGGFGSAPMGDLGMPGAGGPPLPPVTYSVQPGGVTPGPTVPVAPTSLPPQPGTGSGGAPPGGKLKGDTYFVPFEAKPKFSEKETVGPPADDFDKKPDGKGIKDGLPKPSSADPKDTAPAGSATQPPAGNAPPPPAQESRRIIIRSGDIEFEIESFDSGLATITKIVTGIKGAFVGTVNSEKLPNGKVKGTITVRTPPESLDSLVLDLRKELGKGGELKSVRLASSDITKQYTDLESRLRAARAMETRLLDIIKTGKGEIKQLLEAERELGVWRTKIEEAEGELRYFANLASLSTLNITLMEKEIRAAAGVTENERVQAGVEVEDVDKTYQAVLNEVLDAKGRVTKSELKQLSAGQFNAVLHFEVSPESSGLIRDRLRQMGRVARLEIDRTQQAEGTVPKDAKVTRGNTIFIVQLYNLANVAPRETATVTLAVLDVTAAYNTLRDAIAKASGHVVVAELSETTKQNVSGQLNFDVRRTEDGAIRTAITTAGDVTSRVVTRAPESDNVTDTKVMYQIRLVPVANIAPRETATLTIAVADVPAAYNALRDAVTKANGRVTVSQLSEPTKQNITAQLSFEVRRSEEGNVRTAIAAAGDVTSRTVARAAESEQVTDTKVAYQIALIPSANLRPRDTVTLNIAVADVAATYNTIREAIAAAKGQVFTSQLDETDKQNVNATLDFDLRKADEAAVKAALDNAGEAVSRNVTQSTEQDTTRDKVLYSVKLLPANRLKPRETTTLGLEVQDVDQTMAVFIAQFNEVHGRQLDAKHGRERNGRATAKLVYEVPLASAASLVERFKTAGTIRVLNSTRDPQAPEGKNATARIDVLITSAESIVPQDEGLWTPVKKGLSYSASFLLTSLTWLVFVLCVILPWALVGYGGYRVVRRVTRPTPSPVVPVAPPPAPEAHA
jgi:hypothetical protein